VSGHLLTWRLWLRQIARLDDPESVAQALSIAAPDGPRGFACVDECQCTSSAARLASRLYVEIVERFTVDMEHGEQHLVTLTNALRLDLANRPTREFRSKLLAQADVIVSQTNANIAHTRAEWPGVSAVVARLTEEAGRRR